MGVCYDLISDSARVGYELGKGAWSDDGFTKALRSGNPVAALEAFLTKEEPGFRPETIAKISQEIAAFVAAYPDWRLVDDCGSWDGSVMDMDEIKYVRREMLASNEDPDDEGAMPMYRKVGSRYHR